MPDQTEQVTPVIVDPLEDDRQEIRDLEAELERVKAERFATIQDDAVAADQVRLEKEKERLRAEIEYERAAAALLARARGEEVPAEPDLGAAPSAQSSPEATRVGQAGPSASPSTSTSPTSSSTSPRPAPATGTEGE